MSEPQSKPRVYVNAFFCESILEEKDSQLTAIRIAHGYTVNPLLVPPRRADGSLDHENPLVVFQPLIIAALIVLRSEEPTEINFQVRGTSPSGRPCTNTIPLPPIRIAGGAEGEAFKTGFRIPTAVEGDFWFEFLVDDQVANKVPLRIKHGSPLNALEPSSELVSPSAAGPQTPQS